jgi:hypothetical protein
VVRWRALIVLALIAMAWSAAGRAADWVVGSGLVFHLGGGSYCNNRITKGVGVELGGFAAGVYDNSNCATSAYVAKTWLPIRSEHWRGGLIGGLVTGYNSAVTPVLGLAVAYEMNRWGLNAIGIPPSGDSSPAVIWLQVKRRWD